jgi:hypothetical protein
MPPMAPIAEANGRQSQTPERGELFGVQRGSSHRTFDLLRTGKGQWFEPSTNACKGASFEAFSHDGLAVSPHSVPGDADAPSDCRDQKDLQMQACPKRLKGLEPLDLLHGKQSTSGCSRRQLPANESFPAHLADGLVFEMSAIDGGLRTE